MVRLSLIAALLVLVALPAGAQIKLGGQVKLGGRVKLGTVTGGPANGAGTGVEGRYATISAEPNFVVGCSEPQDAPNGEVFDYADGSGHYDNSVSPDASECWDRGNSTLWERDHYQTGHSQTIEAVSNWGDVQYAANQPSGSGDFWNGFRPPLLVSTFGLTTATICYRYYKQVSSDYATASNDCGGGTNRNKFTELNIANHPFQLEEDVTATCDTASGSPRGIMACFDSGPGMEPDQDCPWLSPTVRISEAITRPIRIEQCYETTDLATGANGVVKVYVTRLDTGVTSSYTSPSATLGAPTNSENWMANLDHTGQGESWSGYFMQAVWDDVNNHTIGAACEIEGGC